MSDKHDNATENANSLVKWTSDDIVDIIFIDDMPKAEWAPPWTEEGDEGPTEQSETPPAPDAELIFRYGDPVSFNADGEVTGINERFFAGRYHSQGEILFEPGENTFYDYTSKAGLWRRVSQHRVRERISAQILQYGRDNAIALTAKITTSRVGAVMNALRGIAEKPCAFAGRFETFRYAGKTLLLAPDVPGDFLNTASASVLKSLVGGDFLTAEAKGSNEVFIRQFVRTRLERAKGDVSSSELVEAYFRFCAKNGWKPQSIRTVEKALPDLILEMYGASKSHCVVRDGRPARGWRAVRLKSEAREASD